MMAIQFKKATKSQSRLRMTIDGPSGSGKTFTGLIFATALAQGRPVAVIDTERGSASKYADKFDFDVLELDSFSPQNYVDGIKAAEAAGYAVILIDSLSHAWEGDGGVLDLHDQATKRERTHNSYTAWKDVTPIHRNMVDAILQSPCHIITTMRSKTEYVLTQNERGKQVPQKIGMAPVQRAGMEYEFDIIADMDTDHVMVISKSRCTEVDQDVVTKPAAEWMAKVIAWLTDGAPVTEPQVDSEQAGATDAQQEPTTPAPKPQAMTRPFLPATLRDLMAKKVAQIGTNGTKPPNGIKGACVGALDALFTSTGRSKETATMMRHSLAAYLLGEGKASSAQWTDAECRALLAWAQDEVEGDYIPDGNAVKEAALIVEAAERANGQEELAL